MANTGCRVMSDSDSKERLAAAILSRSRPGRTGQAPDDKEKYQGPFKAIPTRGIQYHELY